MKISLSILFLFLFSHQFSYAQQTRSIAGKVIENETGLPLSGVSIRIKGKNSGTTTDQSGGYRLNIPSDQETLIFNFLGYETKELPAIGNILNVTLSNSPNSLNEVVVIAYGTAKRSSYVGSVSQIKSEQLENRQVSNISSAL